MANGCAVTSSRAHGNGSIRNHFVCRERSLAEDHDRLISREIVVHVERGVITDQFYAERLYSKERLEALLSGAGFSNLRSLSATRT